MPLIPEEPQIHESAQGPRAVPANGRTAPTPRPVPGPRPAPPARPGHPGALRATAPAQRTPRDAAVRPGPQAPDTTPAPSARPEASGVAGTAESAGSAAPQIQVVPASAEGALDAAEEAVDLLLESGRAPGDILVVTTGDPHPWAVHELSFGEASYWAQHDARDDVFYADAAAVGRAAERPVVVVAVNSDGSSGSGGVDGNPADSVALAAARTRAGTLLIVCGDPQLINSALGTKA